MVRCLGALRTQPECVAFGDIIADLEDTVAAGSRLSATMSRYPKVFNKLYLTMVRMGEDTGQLETSMERLSGWIERDESLNQQLKSSLTYPVFVLALSVVLTLGIFTVVLPSFISIFEEMNTPLPLITKVLVFLTKCTCSPLAWTLGLALIGALWLAVHNICQDEKQKANAFSLLLRMPGIGGLLFHGSSARYCAALATLLSSGMDVTRALKLAASASGNPVIERDAKKLMDSVSEGAQMSAHMSAFPEIYSRTLSQMAVAGEESSKLPEMFERAGAFHELELKSSMEALSAALEPLLLAGVAIVVGTILVAIFLPLYGILENLG